MSGTKVHQMRALTCAHLSHVRHQLSGVELRDAHQVFAVGLVDAQQRQVQGGGQLIAQTSCEIVLNKCQMSDINFHFARAKVHSCRGANGPHLQESSSQLSNHGRVDSDALLHD